jgi:type I restriction enzyme M protein
VKGKVAKKYINDKLFGAIGYVNDSKFTLMELKNEGETSIKNNFISYLNSFKSKKLKKDDPDLIQEVIKNSGIRKHINKLNSNGILYSLIEEFTNVDLMPKSVSNIKMGYIFEELVRRFSEQNNAEAGEHYTPREVIDLMVQMLDINERKLKSGELVTIYDPACGTGGMLTSGKEYIENNVNKNANVRLYGQEVNDKTWSICQADLMIKGEDAKIEFGDTLFEDGFPAEKFDYMLSNPPYGKSWSKIKTKVMNVSNGRFDIGQPRTSDGQLLFTLQMLSKMKLQSQGGSAIAIVHNGSPLFSGDAGSGESKIREYIIGNDLLETIVALPTDLFYNTGIATYVWIIKNKKKVARKGKIQLINVIDFWDPMKRSLGKKRRMISDKNVERIVNIHKEFKPGKYSKIYDLDDFAYRKVTIELEELDEYGNPVYEDKIVTIAQGKVKQAVKGKVEDIKTMLDKKQLKPSSFTFDLKRESEFVNTHNTHDTKITIQKEVNNNRLKLSATIRIPVVVKDTEIIPWKDNWEEWLNKEVEKKWSYVDEKKGYEIPFTREFYIYKPLPKLKDLLDKLTQTERENQSLLNELEIKL